LFTIPLVAALLYIEWLTHGPSGQQGLPRLSVKPQLRFPLLLNSNEVF